MTNPHNNKMLQILVGKLIHVKLTTIDIHCNYDAHQNLAYLFSIFFNWQTQLVPLLLNLLRQRAIATQRITRARKTTHTVTAIAMMQSLSQREEAGSEKKKKTKVAIRIHAHGYKCSP